METLLQVAQGEFNLQRLPYRKKELLRAWDAADEYLLNALAEDDLLFQQANILIFNDSFGALAIALHEFKPSVMSDSYLSQTATRLNLKTHQIPENTIRFLSSLELPKEKLDFVLIKVPKTLAFLEDFLVRIQPFIETQTQVIVAGMVKTMPTSVWKLLESLVGETRTSLAKKKAKLIFVSPQVKAELFENPYPVYYQLENTRYQICNHANVFSRDSLDIGTRFLLSHLPVNSTAKNIVDLGCGNGVVGLMLAEKHPTACLHFVDESFMALASATENFSQAFGDKQQAKFYAGDGLTAFADDSMDLIVCNPPFHQQNTIGDTIALSLFKHAKRVLKEQGELWVIGNRHLGYHKRLQALFANNERRAENAKFVILKAIK